MHYTPLLALVSALASLAFMPQAWGQIHQCKDAGGKTIFSQTPCVGSGPSKVISSEAPPPRSAPSVTSVPPEGARDWAAENAAANKRAKAGDIAQARSAQAAQTAANRAKLDAANKPQGRVTDQQITADCEANRGVRCGSKGEINKRRFEQYEESTMKGKR